MVGLTGIVFDLGGVVIDWNPRNLYRKIFHEDTERIDWFLANICTLEWNERQDAGRLLEDGTEELVARFPEWEQEIRAYYGRWIEMIGGQIPGTEILLRELSGLGYRLFALSNWSRETFPLVRPHYQELSIFEKVFLSADYGVAKPDLRFFEAALSEIDIPRSQIVFIDDNRRNVMAALGLGIASLTFTGAEELRDDLRRLGIPL